MTVSGTRACKDSELESQTLGGPDPRYSLRIWKIGGSLGAQMRAFSKPFRGHYQGRGLPEAHDLRTRRLEALTLGSVVEFGRAGGTGANLALFTKKKSCLRTFTNTLQ